MLEPPALSVYPTCAGGLGSPGEVPKKKSRKKRKERETERQTDGGGQTKDNCFICVCLEGAVITRAEMRTRKEENQRAASEASFTRPPSRVPDVPALSQALQLIRLCGVGIKQERATKDKS